MTDRTFTFPFSDEEDDGAAEGGWITWFCRMEEHELLVEVDEEYVRDNFNLYGLKARIENYDKALKMILSSEQPDAEDFRDLDFRKVYRDARELYGLIHCRYIMSPRGLTQMREKYIRKPLASVHGFCAMDKMSFRSVCGRSRTPMASGCTAPDAKKHTSHADQTAAATLMEPSSEHHFRISFCRLFQTWCHLIHRFVLCRKFSAFASTTGNRPFLQNWKRGSMVTL